jgi:hypothetical protein
MHSRRGYEVTKIGMAQGGHRRLHVKMAEQVRFLGSIQPSVSCAHSGLPKSSGTSSVSADTTSSNCVFRTIPELPQNVFSMLISLQLLTTSLKSRSYGRHTHKALIIAASRSLTLLQSLYELELNASVMPNAGTDATLC